MGKKSESGLLRSRIVGEGDEAPDQLMANPLNWRKHPKNQIEALEGLLKQVGWVQRIIVNKSTGHVVDGHARVELALRRNEERVPVVYVELSDAEERLVLAALDPIGGLATTDAEKLDELLQDVRAQDESLQALLDDLAKSIGIDDVDLPEDKPVNDESKNLLIIETASERECEKLFQEMTERGFGVRVME